MSKRRCVIFVAGEPSGIPDGLKDAYIIAADAGFGALKGQMLTPDILIGDFDSLGHVPEGVKVLRHPVEKDDTDMALAAEYAVSLGFRELYLFGATGGRTDHTLANLQLIAGLSQRGIRPYIISERERFTAVTNDSISVYGSAGTIVSVFCMGDEARGVTLRGMKYPLDNATITCTRPLGVSNELLGSEGVVTVSNGTLLVVVSAAE